ncbi:hypothetical protein HK102_008972, partial [Quaeritorhiza haematococci]
HNNHNRDLSCRSCHRNVETLEHILFGCEVTVPEVDDLFAEASTLCTSSSYRNTWNSLDRNAQILYTLGQPQHGFTQDFQDRLWVINNGAIVHGMRPLHNMYRANVGGTETVVELATSGQIKHLHFVWDLVGVQPAGHNYGEDDSDTCDAGKGAVAGYPQSKYLAERAVQILID